jgi:hypothetical protein
MLYKDEQKAGRKKTENDIRGRVPRGGRDIRQTHSRQGWSLESMREPTHSRTHNAYTHVSDEREGRGRWGE